MNVRIQQSTKESVIALQVRRMFLSCASSEGLHKFSQTVEMHVRACVRACARARVCVCVCVCVCVWIILSIVSFACMCTDCVCMGLGETSEKGRGK